MNNRKISKPIPENFIDWKIDGYNYTKEEAIEVFKNAIEENNGNFYYNSIENLEKILLEIIDNESEIMFFPIDEKIDEKINKLKNFKIYDLNALAGEKNLKYLIKNIKIGITGADALAAESGSIILCDNSSMKSYAAFLPEKHIVISYESILFSTILEALKYLWENFVDVPSTIQIIQGPSKTGDIEKKIVRPSHGPKELHIILLKD
ncbi:MAG: lactate utilization protein [Thermoplasmata archaeon]